MRQIAQPLVLELQTGQPPFGNLARIASVAVRTTQLYRRVVVHGQPVGFRVAAQTTHTLPVDFTQRLIRGRRCGRRVPAVLHNSSNHASQGRSVCRFIAVRGSVSQNEIEEGGKRGITSRELLGGRGGQQPRGGQTQDDVLRIQGTVEQVERQVGADVPAR